MLNFVVCDDNLFILNKLSKMLEAIFIKNNIDANITLKSSNANEVINYVQANNSVDVLILDINLNSDMNGCDIADIVRKKNKNVYIIFTTGHLEYALIAYKYKTFDYLPKPIVNEKLEETILRLLDDAKCESSKFIKFDNKTIINQDEINYIQKDGMKLVFHTTSNNTYETYSSFNKIQSCLPGNFIRCHKSYIANINNISNVIYNKNTIFFDKDEQCSIGAKYKDTFLEVIKNESFTDNMVSSNNTK